MRFSTVCEEGARHGLLPPPTHGQSEAERELQLREHFLTTSRFENLATLLDRFGRTQAVLRELQTVERISYEAVEDAARDNVRVLELRYSPAFLSEGHDYSWEEALAAIEKGVAAASAEHGVAVGLVCIAVGAMGGEAVTRTAEFAVAQRARFVGFDLAGAETGLAHFEAQFAAVRRAGLPCTCHAAEDAHGDPTNAQTALDALGCVRIGHGVQVVSRSGAALRAVERAGATLEVSLSSNYLTRAFDLTDHPARVLHAAGVPLTINSDDPGIMDLTLCGEHRLWHDVLGFLPREMYDMQLHALEACFLPADAKAAARAAHFPPWEEMAERVPAAPESPRAKRRRRT